MIFSNCYLAVPWPTLGHCRGGSLTNLMLISVGFLVQPDSHHKPQNKVGSQSPVLLPILSVTP